MTEEVATYRFKQLLSISLAKKYFRFHNNASDLERMFLLHVFLANSFY